MTYPLLEGKHLGSKAYIVLLCVPEMYDLDPKGRMEATFGGTESDGHENTVPQPWEVIVS